MDYDDLKESIEHLTQSIEELNKRWVPWRHLTNGMLSGIGAAIGATLVLAVIVWALNGLARVDVLKPAVNTLIPYIDRTQQIPSINYVEDQATPIPSPTIDPSLSPSPTPSPTL